MMAADEQYPQYGPALIRVSVKKYKKTFILSQGKPFTLCNPAMLAGHRGLLPKAAKIHRRVKPSRKLHTQLLNCNIIVVGFSFRQILGRCDIKTRQSRFE